MANRPPFRGTFTAIVTPLDDAGALDEAALEGLVGEQIEAGVEGIVFLGTTGESPTISEEEAARILKLGVRLCKGRTLVVAGCGSNDTHKTAVAARKAQDRGADALLVVAPYYNKPTQGGLLRHFEAVAVAADIPLIVYNIPGRTGVNILPATLRQMAEHPRIAAVKEASGDINQIMDIIAEAPDGFAVLSGDDALTLPVMALGGHGVVSVVSNIVPGRVKELVDRALVGDFTAVRRAHSALLPLVRACFLETNPIPVKTALAMRGRIREVFRPPLCAMTVETRECLRRALAKCGLL